MIELPAIFDTDRLHLRRPRIDDADAVFHAFASDPEVSRYTSWRPHASVDESRAFVERCVDAWESGRGERVYVIEHETRLAGVIGVTIEGGERARAALGYALGRAFWSHGLMTEAACALTDHLLARPSVFRVWAVCDVDNVASARVMEKVGMRFEGILRRWCVHPNVSPDPRDCRCYAIVR